jgi:hypothetical protein
MIQLVELLQFNPVEQTSMNAGLANKKTEEMQRNDVSVKLDAQVAREAKLVATYKGISVAQYISDVLRPIVHRDLEAEAGGMLKKGTDKPKGGAK